VSIRTCSGANRGGGNFGVFIAFEFALHQVDRTCSSGCSSGPPDQGREALQLALDHVIGLCLSQPACHRAFEYAQAPADIATGYWRLPPGGQAAAPVASLARR